MTTIVRVVLAAGGMAALAAWVRHVYRPRVDEMDEFADIALAEADGVEIDDDTAAEIIRRAGPQLERARELLQQN